jgi:hypothetical protein
MARPEYYSDILKMMLESFQKKINLKREKLSPENEKILIGLSEKKRPNKRDIRKAYKLIKGA